LVRVRPTDILSSTVPGPMPGLVVGSSVFSGIQVFVITCICVCKFHVLPAAAIVRNIWIECLKTGVLAI